MSFGLQQAGIQVLAGIDNEIACKQTYEANIKGARFIHADVFKLEEKSLSEDLGIEKYDNNLILIGCSPCQFWSIINTEKTKSEKSKNLLTEFKRFVEYFMPGYVIVENVPGVLRKKEESGLQSFIDWLQCENNYKIHFDVHNVFDFGVPQNRKRFTLIANRVSNVEIVPIRKEGKRLHVRDVLGPENGFKSIEAGHKDNSSFLHSCPGLSEVNKKRLKLVHKDGGNRLGFAHDPDLQLKCFEGSNKSFVETFGRLWWDRPAPTITTKFIGVSNGRFVHPDEDRALSIREGAVLQSFPKDYEFYGKGLATMARMIGNAVPPEYARRIGLAILESKNNGTISSKG